MFDEQSNRRAKRTTRRRRHSHRHIATVRAACRDIGTNSRHRSDIRQIPMVQMMMMMMTPRHVSEQRCILSRDKSTTTNQSNSFVFHSLYFASVLPRHASFPQRRGEQRHQRQRDKGNTQRHTPPHIVERVRRVNKYKKLKFFVHKSQR